MQERVESVNPEVIVLSGGPNSVHLDGAPNVYDGFFEYCEENSIPVLGICYGMQLIVKSLGGVVEKADKSEYGRMPITISSGSELYGDDVAVQVRSASELGELFHFCCDD
eukprot:8331084-Pyramimonas_sp.AAC.1